MHQHNQRNALRRAHLAIGETNIVDLNKLVLGSFVGSHGVSALFRDQNTGMGLTNW